MTILYWAAIVIGAIFALVAAGATLALLGSVVYWSIKVRRAKRDFFRAARSAGLMDEKFSVAAWRAEHDR